jgi:hypothetical protein
MCRRFHALRVPWCRRFEVCVGLCVCASGGLGLGLGEAFCLRASTTSCGRVRRLNVSSNVWDIVYPSLRARVGSMGLAVYQ